MPKPSAIPKVRWPLEVPICIAERVTAAVQESGKTRTDWIIEALQAKLQGK